ncbi:MAG TPA: RNA methyltransferase [Gemmataceae bacterium]|nr:RNA methyltransferase [Gemmataceae bacterium]
MSLHRCRVVLVRPRIAANIGAIARVMRNLGLGQLVLVAPEADPADPQARRLATHGESILEQARVVADFGEAVADCVLVAGTSARIGGPFRRQSVGTPEEIMPHLVASLAAGPVALVFGPEPSGLTNAEVSRCHFLIHIPADPDYPVLNLAQAAAICLYELRRLWLKQPSASLLPAARERGEGASRPAPFADQERMFEHLRVALEKIHFLYGPAAGPLMHALRHLIGRARPTAMEVDLLFGLARQIRWYADHARPLSPSEEGAPQKDASTNPQEEK